MFVADCAGNSHRKNPDMPKIEFEVKALNDGSHFSHEEYGVLMMNIVMFILFSYFFGSTLLVFMKDVKKQEALDSPTGLLVVGIFIELCHIGSNIIHLWVYSCLLYTSPSPRD